MTRHFANNVGKWIGTRFDGFESPVTIQSRSQTCSDLTPSCARQATPCPTNSVSTLNKEIRKLTECICQHNEVTAELLDALILLTKIQQRKHEHDGGTGVRCACRNDMQSKRWLRMENVSNDNEGTRDTTPVDADDPMYVPMLDTNFSVHHMPSDQRSRRQPPALDGLPITKVDVTSEPTHETRWDHRGARKSPMLSTSLRKHYNYLALVGSDGVVNVSELLRMNVEKIPNIMSLLPNIDYNIFLCTQNKLVLIFCGCLTKFEASIRTNPTYGSCRGRACSGNIHFQQRSPQEVVLAASVVGKSGKVLVSRQFVDNVAQICVLEFCEDSLPLQIYVKTESYEKTAYLSKFSGYEFGNSNEYPPLECWAHDFSIQDMECYPSLSFYETLSIEPISTIK
ncbi:hypothetical protein HN51_058707, partial [Arachis hypogaea]